MANEFDAIVIGGGHNGLVAAAYLAKKGARTVVLEANDRVGGAAETSSPWPEAPEIKVTTLSYVMSLMPPEILRDLRLHEFGYKIFPLGLGYLPLPDGRSLVLSDDEKTTHESFARFSKKDAETLPKYYEWMGRMASLMQPMLMETPPKLGSRSLGDSMDQLRFLLRHRKDVDVRTIGDITKLFSMSAADLLDEWFENDVVKGLLAVNGIIGTWAGPCEPGTAYVLMHHSIGEEAEGQISSWGFPEGGMGAVSNAIRRSAESFGATVRVNARVERVLVRGGNAVGVALASGEELRAPVLVTTVHPRIAFLRHLEASELPDDFVRDLRNWRTRSGTVKVNLALSELPEFTANPGFDPAIHGGAIQVLDDLEYLERAFQQARTGQAAELPFSDTEIPTVFDKTLAPEGIHIMSMFTQWVPHTWSEEPHREELEAYADRLVERVNDVAPNFKRSIMHRQVIGPYDMEQGWGLIGGNIFHGELTVDQLFHMRPAPGFADYRTPIPGLYQASSGTHAGGGVTGLPGHHVVRELVKDRKLAKARR